ncbi:MAG: PP2C family protein-serine/threonine phosphatase [Rhizobiaceae bacterium]
MPSRTSPAGDIPSLLRAHPLISGLREAVFDRLMSEAVPRAAEAGAVLLRQGEPSDFAILLTEGTVEVVAETVSGEIRLASVAAPALLGEIGVIAGLPRTATIRALGPVRFLSVGKDVFNRLADDSPYILRHVVGRLGAQLKSMNSAIGAYTDALVALENESFDQSVFDSLNNPSAELANFAETFRRMAAQIALRQRQREELAGATAIQRAMLPDPLPRDRAARFELFAAMRPAREVGGDFYDAFFLDADRLVVTIGDVSGKGVPAALFMAVCQTTLRMTLRQSTPEKIAEAIERANALLETENSASMFATFLGAILDLRNGSLAYCNCGHNPPLVQRRNGRVETLRSGGIALGVVTPADCERQAAFLEPGDRLLLFTDGITEAHDPAGELFEEERLHASVAVRASADTRGLVDGLFEDVHVFAAGAPQHDDLTCLAISYRGTTPGA